MLTKVLISGSVILYVVAGFYTWIATILLMSGQNPSDSYYGRLVEFARGGKIQSLLASSYTFLLWPVHLLLTKLFA